MTTNDLLQTLIYELIQNRAEMIRGRVETMRLHTGLRGHKWKDKHYDHKVNLCDALEAHANEIEREAGTAAEELSKAVVLSTRASKA